MSIVDILKTINIIPNDLNLFYQAFTHRSYTNEKKYSSDYQRLEFLGDAILSKVAALKTFNLYPNLDEGQMTIIRSNSVSGVALANFAKELNFEKLIRIGKNNEDILNNTKILADVFEAFVGAIYLDQGEKVLDIFLDKNVYKFIKNSKGKEIKNPKTIFQEFLQSESRKNIIYDTKKKKNYFESIVKHNGNLFGKGIGQNKKEAEINAAKNALNKLRLNKGKKYETN